MPNDVSSKSEDAMLQAERKRIRLRRKKVWGPEGDTPQESDEDFGNSWNLMGIAFSGGGIRSATFGLGVLQGLASLGILRCADYLSTVSGGGYIGSWLATWIKRDGSFENVVKQLHPTRRRQSEGSHSTESTDVEPAPIFHLRRYSNYLSPNLSLFAADSWTLGAIYIRNLLANQLCLIPMVFAVLLVVRLVTSMFALPRWNIEISLLVAGGVLVALIAAFVLVYRSLSDLATMEKDSANSGDKDARAGTDKNFSAKCKWIIGLLSCASPLLCLLLHQHAVPGNVDRPSLVEVFAPRLLSSGSFPESLVSLLKSDLFLLSSLFAILHGLASLVLVIPKATEWWQEYHSANGDSANRQESREPLKALVRTFIASCGSGAVGGALYYLILTRFVWRPEIESAVLATFGPPLTLMAFAAAAKVEVIFLGRTAAESLREWFARLCAWCLIIACSWLSIFGLCLFGGLWLLQANRWLRTAFSLSWIGSAIGGLLAARSARSGQPRQTTWLDRVSTILPYAFLAGLVCIMSLVTHLIVAGFQGDQLSKFDQNAVVDIRPIPIESESGIKLTDAAKQARETRYENAVLNARYHAHIDHPVMHCLFGTIGVSILIAMLVSYFIDINEFSLNALYANRLTRCYLGASNKQRKPNDLTGFDSKDDLSLRELEIGRTFPPTAANPKTYWGPFPVINTALNLVSGDELAWQERKAESFVVTPLHFGCRSLGYAKNEFDYSNGDGSLGRCVSVSGAAANPNMGYHSSPAMTALLALFNVRFGWWLPNPKLCSSNEAQRKRPTFLMKWLLKELFGLTDDQQPFVNLSDGGHFENLAVYELVRRKCRLIIVSDASADPDTTFEDLGNAIRKCRADFGIDIEIDLSHLRKIAGTRFSRFHCAVGTIRYDNVQKDAPVGTLLYLKPTLTGDEPGDVAHYSLQSPTFPQEPTLDQFFSESQFESYRELGVHTAKSALGEISLRLNQELTAREVKDKTDTDQSADELHDNAVANLVYHIRKKWFLPETHSLQEVLAVNEPFLSLQKDLMNESELAHFSTELYAETLGHPNARKDLHFASQMIQVMENAWVGMNLEKDHAHPLNSGWMNLFRRWSSVPTLQCYWPMLRHEYAREFVSFCQRQTALKTVVSDLKPVKDLPQNLRDQLKKEFRSEWSCDDESDEAAKAVLEAIHASVEFPPEGSNDRFWYVDVKVRGFERVAEQSHDGRFVAGVIGLRTLKSPAAPSVHELFVWVRPAYREHGVGQKMIQSLQGHDFYRSKEKDGAYFVIRYPNMAWQGAGSSVKKARWLSYFDFYGFRRPSTAQYEHLSVIEDFVNGFEVLISESKSNLQE